MWEINAQCFLCNCLDSKLILSILYSLAITLVSHGLKLWLRECILTGYLAGYPSHTGTITSGDELWDLVEGMQSNDVLHYTHLLTGYIGSVSFLKTIVKLVKRLRETNPELVYGTQS